jgi:transcriptional regulator with XRE-family HTH domain
MAIKLDDYLAKLSKKDQRAIAKRAAELIAEEATLRQLRVAREQSQEAVAKQLHIKQAAVSKLERRTDMYLSTLRSYIEAMGGKLEIIARFPNRAVRINQFEALGPTERPRGQLTKKAESAQSR